MTKSAEPDNDSCVSTYCPASCGPFVINCLLRPSSSELLCIMANFINCLLFMLSAVLSVGHLCIFFVVDVYAVIKHNTGFSNVSSGYNSSKNWKTKDITVIDNANVETYFLLYLLVKKMRRRYINPNSYRYLRYYSGARRLYICYYTCPYMSRFDSFAENNNSLHLYVRPS